jgi:hypothetical protein
MEQPTLIFQETKTYEQGFQQHFNQKIAPKLGTIEQERLTQLAIYKSRLPKGIILALIIWAVASLAILLFSIPVDENIIGLFYGLPAVLIYGWVNMPKLAYRKTAKVSILPELLSFFGTLTYSLEGKFDPEKLKQSRVFKDFDHQKSEDFINGQLNDLNFNFAEVHLLKNSDKKTITIFNGEIAEIQMHKNFHGQTIIVEENQHANTSNGFLGIGADPNKKFELVQLEDPVFEKTYKVYSTDQIEARYILTTSFIERLLKLREFYNGARLRVSFYNKSVMIAVSSNRDLFEPKGIKESAINTDDIHKFLAEINEYQELINILKLNQNIGM